MRTHAVAASSDAPGDQPGEGGPQPTLLLQLLGAEDFTATRYTIRPVAFETASRWFARWHYLADSPVACEHWGIFAPDLGAVVSIGPPVGNISGVAARLGLVDIPGNREIARVAVHPNMPGPTSRLMWLAVRTAHKRDGWAWAFSYADTGRGHHGGIYQALGAVYVGLGDARPGWVDAAGNDLHPRQAVALFGSQSTQTMNAHGYERVDGFITPKHTYVLPVGPLAAEVRARLAPFALPYPKRAYLAGVGA